MVARKILLPLSFCCIAKYSTSSTGITIIRNTGNKEEEEERERRTRERKKDKGEKEGGGGEGKEEEEGKEGGKRRRHCFKFFEPSDFPHQYNFGMHLLPLLLFILNKRLALYQSMVLSLFYQFLSLSNVETFENYFSAIFSALSTSNNALV
jgi:hypothetical protein